MGLLGNDFSRWMGLKAAKQREKDEASRRDSDIGRQLKLEKEKAKKTFKILLVGTHTGKFSAEITRRIYSFLYRSLAVL